MHILVRRDGLAETMSRYLIRRIEETPNIHLRTPCPRSPASSATARGSGPSNTENRDTGKTVHLETPSVFLFLGARPCTSGSRERSPSTTRDSSRPGPTSSRLIELAWNGPFVVPRLFESSLPRVYAVGDVRSGSVKRVASAVGEGSIVVQFIHRALNEG